MYTEKGSEKLLGGCENMCACFAEQIHFIILQQSLEKINILPSVSSVNPLTVSCCAFAELKHKKTTSDEDVPL